jgi:hypothetical protein
LGVQASPPGILERLRPILGPPVMICQQLDIGILERGGTYTLGDAMMQITALREQQALIDCFVGQAMCEGRSIFACRPQ